MREDKAGPAGNDRDGAPTRPTRVLLAIAVVLFAATRYYILFVLTADPKNKYVQSEVVVPYCNYALRAADNRETPYSESFLIEYPPLGWWAIYVPRLLDERQITNLHDSEQVVPVVSSYTYAFRGLMCLLDTVAFWFFTRIALRRRPELAGWAAMFYVVLSALLGFLLFDRLDVGLTFFLMLWAYAWMRSMDNTKKAVLWIAAAYLSIGLGICYKIVPVVCLPFLLLAELFAPRPARRPAMAAIALAAGIGLPFLIQYDISGNGVFQFVKYHSEREIHLESLYSTLMMLTATAGSPVRVSHGHGGFNLTGNSASMMKVLAMSLLIGFPFGMGVWAALRRTRYDRRTAYCFSCYVIIGSVILAHVFSPQYLLWAFPLILLLALEVLPPGQIWPWLFGALLLVVAASTTWIYPCHYFYGNGNFDSLLPPGNTGPLPESPTARIVLGLRNFAYLGIVVWLGVMLYRRFNLPAANAWPAGSS
jgi:hypothetical protein